MAVELLKEMDPDKVIAWDKLHDKRKLYRCERCCAEWKCEYGENILGKSHEMNGDPDILCQCCGFPTVKEVTTTETYNNDDIECVGSDYDVKYFSCKIDMYMFPFAYTSKGSLWLDDKKAGELTAISDSVVEYGVMRLVFELEPVFNWLWACSLNDFDFKLESDEKNGGIKLKLYKKGESERSDRDG